MKRLEERVFLIPVRVLNSESPDPMGVRAWDWKHCAVQATQKIDAVFLVMKKIMRDYTLELAGGEIKETSLEKAPYATPYGVII